MTIAASAFVTSKADWYLMRASGVVSLVLLTAVMTLGIATVRRWRPGRLPRFVTPSLHRSLSLLAVVFLVVHVATALADPYALVSLASVFVPFVAAGSPFWVGLGAVSLDLIAALVVSGCCGAASARGPGARSTGPPISPGRSRSRTESASAPTPRPSGCAGSLPAASSPFRRPPSGASASRSGRST
jgi:hypothetical protein